MVDPNEPFTSEVTSKIPGEDEPHRRWHNVDPIHGRMDLEVLILASRSHRAVVKLIQKAKHFNKDEMLTLAELNFRCWLQGYEPVALLIAGQPVRLNGAIDRVLDEALRAKIFQIAEDD